MKTGSSPIHLAVLASSLAAWPASTEGMPEGAGDWGNRMSGEKGWRGRSVGFTGDGGREERRLQYMVYRAQSETGGLDLEE